MKKHKAAGSAENGRDFQAYRWGAGFGWYACQIMVFELPAAYPLERADALREVHENGLAALAARPFVLSVF